MASKKHKVEVLKDDDKLHRSSFLLTINSNSATIRKSDFKEQVYDICENIHEYIATNKGHTPDDEMIISTRPRFEIGEKYHRIHSHILVEIQHNSNIKIDLVTLREKLPGWHFDVVYIKGSSDIERVINYTRKNQ